MAGENRRPVLIKEVLRELLKPCPHGCKIQYDCGDCQKKRAQERKEREQKNEKV